MTSSRYFPPVTPRSLADLLRELPGLLTWPLPEARVTGISNDSRRVQPGHLFVACTGDTYDGHVFIPDAVMSGATVIIGEQEVKTASVILRDMRNAQQKTIPPGELPGLLK